MNSKIMFGILTVSDTCFAGTASDKSGPSLVTLVTTQKTFTAESVFNLIVPDEMDKIELTLKQWSDVAKLDVIFTTGGTGFSPRDVTPEATKNVINRDASGITMAMMKASLDVTPLAMLSRGVCGVRGSTLIINLPGSVKGAIEMASAVLVALPHAVALMRGDDKNVKKVHAHLHGVSSREHQCSHSHSESKVDNSKVARRVRESPYPMVSVEEATNIVLASVNILGVQKLSLSKALGHVIETNITSTENLPPFPASTKDGYAVIAADGTGVRQVVGDSLAGDQAEKKFLLPGECMRITTGAPVPPGADAVVQVEDTQLVKEADEGQIEVQISILKAPTVGQDIRPIGSDIMRGEVVVPQGAVLRPPQIGLAASVGVSQVQIFRYPCIAVLSTGDELQDANSKSPSSNRIFDSNRPMLLALLKQQGFSAVDKGIIQDNPKELLIKLREAFHDADVIVTSGGVSMGEKDFLKDVLVKDFGAIIHFGRVEMKPGKPTTFATCEYEGKKKLIFALPGNPVSASVTCQLFVLPALRTMAGHSPSSTQFFVTVKMGSACKLDPRPEYVRAFLEWPAPPSSELPIAHITGKQISSRLLSMHSADALLVLPPASNGLKELAEGDLVKAILINVFH